MTVDSKFIHSEITEKILGLAIKIHKSLGPGFPEQFYEKALTYELKRNNIGWETQKTVPISYSGIALGTQRLDLVVDDKVIVELKAISEINDACIAQIISYLKASGKRVGLILNFAKNKLEIKRVIL